MTTTDTTTAADWSVLTPEVIGRCDIAAASVANACANQVHLDRDDLKQEAYLIAATNPHRVRGYVAADELSYLYVWLRARVLDKAKVEVARSSKSISYEAATPSREAE